MKNRNDLAFHLAELGLNEGAEIGVLGGTYSIILCEANPKLKLYCVDIWNRKGKYEEAQVRLAPYNAKLIRKLSMDAVRDFKDGSLDFVYIDADHHFDAAMEDVIAWSRKVRKGGIVSGHDYDNSSDCGVKDAVDMYVKWHGHELNVLPEADHTWITRSGQPSNALSWWFYK